MRNLLPKACALAVVPLLFTMGSTRADITPQDKAAIDRAAQHTLAETGVPSVSIAVVRDGKIAYLKAYGQAELSPPRAATTSMRYAVGSISKQFTAAAILMLAEEGKLTLDDPVGKYVPGLTEGDRITIRQILSHTSGYEDFWPQDYVFPDMKKSGSAQAILDRWAKAKLNFEPGTDWQYSNTGFVLAGVIIEKVSGERLMQFLGEHIFTPLHMTGVVDFDNGQLTAADAKPYMRYALGAPRPAAVMAPGWMLGAGEVAMRPEDLALWDISEINHSLMSAKSYAAQTTSVLLKSGRDSNYGLGLAIHTVHGRRQLEHGGEVSGFTSENRIYPDERVAIAVLTNSDYSAGAARDVADGIEAVLFKDPDKSRNARALFDALRQGKLDRSKLTANANDYFSTQAIADFKSSLGALGEPKGFKLLNSTLRGGMTAEVYEVDYATRKLQVVLRAMPDGKIEQFMVYPMAE
jgi:D-alanyl-D-alanine carboxypeptidase